MKYAHGYVVFCVVVIILSLPIESARYIHRSSPELHGWHRGYDMVAKYQLSESSRDE